MGAGLSVTYLVRGHARRRLRRGRAQGSQPSSRCAVTRSPPPAQRTGAGLSAEPQVLPAAAVSGAGRAPRPAMRPTCLNRPTFLCRKSPLAEEAHVTACREAPDAREAEVTRRPRPRGRCAAGARRGRPARPYGARLGRGARLPRLLRDVAVLEGQAAARHERHERRAALVAGRDLPLALQVRCAHRALLDHHVHVDLRRPARHRCRPPASQAPTPPQP